MITIEINLINLTQIESWLNNIRILQIRIFKIENKNDITWDPFIMWITKDINNNININLKNLSCLLLCVWSCESKTLL